MQSTVNLISQSVIIMQTKMVFAKTIFLGRCAKKVLKTNSNSYFSNNVIIYQICHYYFLQIIESRIQSHSSSYCPSPSTLNLLIFRSFNSVFVVSLSFRTLEKYFACLTFLRVAHF